MIVGRKSRHAFINTLIVIREWCDGGISDYVIIIIQGKNYTPRLGRVVRLNVKW